MNKEIIKLLQEGYSLLTPTMRMSRYLKNNYAATQIASGNTVWESADILPWHAWLQRAWDETSGKDDNQPFYLNAWQQQSIWLQLVQKSDFAKHLLQPLSVAKRAMQAWELSHQWQLPLFAGDTYISHDVRAFQSWAHAYQVLCEKENWIDDARLPGFLIKRLMTGTSSIQTKLALTGHDDLQPQQKALLKAINASGGDVIILELENKSQKATGSGFVDVYDEINAAANWAGKIMQSNPGETVGIVAPNLQKLRAQLEDEFDNVLLAGAILEPAEPVSKPYNISLGQGLNSYPVIATALSILGLMEQSLSFEDIGSLLRSPFIKTGPGEQDKRATLDATLREYGEPTLSLKNVLFVARNHLNETEQCLTFLSCVQAWQEAMQELPASQSAHEWGRTFARLLSIFEWPGARPLNSTEYQTMIAWQELMVQFVSLDVVTPSLSYRTALAQLRQLAVGFSFQPETAEVPIEVMGYAGAAGMYFDHLWILGLHEEAWPVVTEPNPFIPLELQRKHQLPAASADNRLAHARHMTERLLQSSADVVVSYPRNDRERPLRASSLIKQYLHAADEMQIERRPAYSKLIYNSRHFDYKQDNTAPVISTGQHVSGGTGLFKDQAACAFRAFAKHRLHARALMAPDIGLSAMERGSLLHDVMQLFWQKISGLEMLRGLTAEQENSLIDNSVDAAISNYKKRRPKTFSDRFTMLENQRLKIVLQDWLLIEKQRQDFRIVACEERHNFEFADIEVHTRIDRIDEIDGGHYVIIDYKTGTASINAWSGERPDDPQLPLYAITSKGDIAALVFARIKRGESRFVGIADGEGILPAVKSFTKTQYAKEVNNWNDLFTHWKDVLLRLGSEFRQGKAEVNPKNDSTCQYCDLHALCRIHEIAQNATENNSSVDQTNE